MTAASQAPKIAVILAAISVATGIINTVKCATRVSGATNTIVMITKLHAKLLADDVARVQPGATGPRLVRFGDEQTDWFKASVFEYPDLKQADANLKYPAYTGLAEKQVQDVRSITAVEGTKATLQFRSAPKEP